MYEYVYLPTFVKVYNSSSKSSNDASPSQTWGKQAVIFVQSPQAGDQDCCGRSHDFQVYSTGMSDV